jgi:hypothetical protein
MLLLLNTSSMQGRQNSGPYSGVAESSSLRFVMPCGWARDSRHFEGTTIFWNVPHSVTSQETWLFHDKISVSAGAVILVYFPSPRHARVTDFTMLRCLLNFRPEPFSPRTKNWRLGEAQSRFGLFREGKNLVPVSSRTPNRLASSVVTALTTN